MSVLNNGQSSSWSPVLAGAPQGSILGPFVFLVSINYVPNDLESLAKLFADDTSLFSPIYNPLLSAEIMMNKDLIKISKWAYQWKMSFNPDIAKQAQEVIFSQKSKKTEHPTVYFNHAPVANTNCCKHLGMYLDGKCNFLQHIKEKISKANKGIEVIWKLWHILLKHSLITTFKPFVRPHLDYSDTIHHQPNNESFCSKIERVQYNGALVITGAIRGTSLIKLYNDLGLESLKFRRWWDGFVCSIKSKYLRYLNICII